MPLDSARIKEARSWLTKASDDLRAADHQMSAEPPLLEDVAFHCQQAVEKCLKAFLGWHDRPFRKTHDLIELGRQCIEIDPSLADLLAEAAPLTEYASMFRYPGDAAAASGPEVKSARATAGAVKEAVLARLPEEVRP